MQEEILEKNEDEGGGGGGGPSPSSCSPSPLGPGSNEKAASENSAGKQPRGDCWDTAGDDWGLGGGTWAPGRDTGPRDEEAQSATVNNLAAALESALSAPRQSAARSNKASRRRPDVKQSPSADP